MEFRYSDFQACLNQPFILTEDDLSDELELIRVDLIEQAQTLENREAFSILLQSRKEFILPQKIYQLRHRQLGEIQLFIVPVGQDENGVRYEAVFS